RCDRRAGPARRASGPRRPDRLRDGPRRDAVRDRPALRGGGAEGGHLRVSAHRRVERPADVPSRARADRGGPTGILGAVMRSAVVVGGGIAGLAAAHALANGGVDALLLEASDRPGGVIRTEELDG